jgi:hypothetical protein
MRYLSLLFLLVTISLTSCRNDFEFEPSIGGLEFSKDTVYLDTVFTNIGSSTYRLKVYNRSDKDIKIPQIRLAKGNATKYRIMVDGLTGEDADNSGFGDGKIFNNVELLAKDSLFIFIEVTSDVASANPTDFLYTDKIEFTNVNGAPQDVDLVTLIQDAIFIYPNRTLPDNIKETLTLSGNPTAIEGHQLGDTELNWNNTKPYVVYGYALVPNGKTLNISQGTKVHFHANSGLIVDKQATLNINGELSVYNPDGEIITDNEVRFEGDRLEPIFEDVPGQWGAILLMSQSVSNIKHLTLKNAVVGLYVIPLDIDDYYPSKLNITNSQIYNCSNYGILSIGANINGSNLVVNYCGQASLASIYGGINNYIHCTFNNNWNSSRQAAVIINDYFETTDTIYANNPTNIFNFKNCIIYGSNQNELFIDKLGNASLDYNFVNCLIKVNNTTNNEFYPPTNTTNYNAGCLIANNSVLNNPKFKNANNNDLSIIENSAAIGAGIFDPLVPNDIFGRSRTTNPDLGAYNFVQ